jgi:methyl-accepting chemotaxis protein
MEENSKERGSGTGFDRGRIILVALISLGCFCQVFLLDLAAGAKDRLALAIALFAVSMGSLVAAVILAPRLDRIRLMQAGKDFACRKRLLDEHMGRYRTGLQAFVGNFSEGMIANARFSKAIAGLSDIRPRIDSLLAGLEREEAIMDRVPAQAWTGHSAIGRMMRTFDKSLEEVVEIGRAMEDAIGGILPGIHLVFADIRDSYMRRALSQGAEDEALSLIKRMGAESNRYAEERMHGILGDFSALTQYSEDFARSLQVTIRSVISASADRGLAALKSETREIVLELESFFDDIASFRMTASRMLETSTRQLDNIRGMAKGIEDFAETIRLISLNVNIEAARLSSHAESKASREAASGFKVLAKNLGEFAVKAQDMARGQRDVVDLAVKSLERVNRDFGERMIQLSARVPAIVAKLQPFEGIVTDSFKSLEDVVGQMEGLSAAIDVRLKAIIGKLQFHDLSRQEMQHLVSFMEESLRAERGEGGQALVPEAELADMRARFLERYGKLATTVNERRVLDESLGAGGAPEYEGLEGSVQLF